jgi:PIN domain
MRRIRVANEFFIDSNVFLYAVSPHTAKAERAIELLRMKPTISVQVLNEFVNVSRKKLKLDWLDVEKGLAAAKSLCSVVAIDLETQMRSVELSQANRIGRHEPRPAHWPCHHPKSVCGGIGGHLTRSASRQPSIRCSSPGPSPTQKVHGHIPPASLSRISAGSSPSCQEWSWPCLNPCSRHGG